MPLLEILLVWYVHGSSSAVVWFVLLPPSSSGPDHRFPAAWCNLIKWFKIVSIYGGWTKYELAFSY